MSLPVSNQGPNPQQPGIAAEAFIPDQLIAGNLKLVTDNATITGGALLQRGSVLGKAGFGAITTSAGTARASGTITLAGVPVVGDTLTVQGTAITVVAANPVGNQIVPGIDAASSAALLAAFLIGSTDVNIAKMTYSIAGAVITATALIYGTAGNAYTLATSDAGVFNLSGATLTGGAANTGNPVISAVSAGAQVKQGLYKAVNTDATHAQVFDPNGVEIGVATFGTAFASPHINFTITAGGAAAVAGDTYGFYVVPGSASYKLAAASATDGSEVPSAILVDLADATAGDVNAGIYLMGEFNARALILGPGITVAAVKAAFRGLGMFIKDSVSAADPS